MSASRKHQELVEDTITYFHQRDIACTDFEKHVGQDKSKRPDLWLPDFNTLIEVKTFAPQEREIEEAKSIGQNMLEGKVSAYWPKTFFERFGGDLKSARRKFRVYPTHHTAVLFYDLHSFIHAQTPEELLRGQEYYELAFLKEHPEGVVLVGRGYKERHLRRDTNCEIGAVVFHTGQNSFKVFHHHFAEKNRRIDRNIFSLPEDQQFEYIADKENPQFIKLEEQ